MSAVALAFEPIRHRYSLGTRELVSVTQALAESGLIDTRWYTEDAAIRGTYVHAAIVLHHDNDLAEESLDPGLRPYFDAYRFFLDHSGFQVEAIEERVFNEALGIAGTLDLRGRFPDTPPTATNVIDIKTGCLPMWVGFQTAGYARMLPAGLPPLRRRWALNLQADGKYRLEPLTKRSDEGVFLAALTIAQAKRGWL